MSEHIPQSVHKSLTNIGLHNMKIVSNIMSLVVKRQDWWLSIDKTDIYGWAKPLDDWQQRGGRLRGDALELFKEYEKMGGEDFIPLTKNLTKSLDDCYTLSAKIKELAEDPTWRECQWNRLLAPGGYLSKTMEICKSRKLDAPSPLVVAAIFDHSLNCGIAGKDGSESVSKRVPLKLQGPDHEKEFLRAFLKKRQAVTADSKKASNNTNYVAPFSKLLDAGCMDLLDDGLIKKAMQVETKAT
eukprot:TRINITY_DN1202_c0_g1_i1.p1 TRINITY_DN1202_c0_g1~~TRINITY_DN1202_c0_g1_i1.p1  ORF type:complete len:242 (-),score=35.15 TRINITY_DN1202_c0_g1_i1:53-778(-)